jgi:hypothetical protein
MVHARKFGGLATHQGTADRTTGLGHTLHQHGGLVGLQLAHGQIVQEEERCGAMTEHIVGVHGHEIRAEALEPAPLQGQQQLGAYAVGAGHQHWITITRQADQSAKAAHTTQHLGALGGCGKVLDALHQGIGGGDVHACFGIGEGGLGVWLIIVVVHWVQLCLKWWFFSMVHHGRTVVVRASLPGHE